MREGAGDRKSSVLKSALIAGQMLTPLGLDHSKLEAAEIAKTATWTEGVVELRKSVAEKTVEYGADFIQYTDGSHEWHPPIKGEWSGVRTRADDRKRLDLIKENKGERSVEFVCNIHTHHADVVRYNNRLSKDAPLPYSPPSRLDVSLRNKIVDAVEFARERIGTNIVRYAVFETQGAWYYRGITQQEQDREIEKDPARKENLAAMQTLNMAVGRLQSIISRYIRTLPDSTIEELGTLLPESSRAIIANTPHGERKGQLQRSLMFQITNPDFPIDETLLTAVPPNLRDQLRQVRAQRGEVEKANTKFVQDREKMLVDSIRNFGKANTTANFDFSKEYRELVEVYRKYGDAVVRFTPYEQLATEPACAGPDYMPEKK